MVDTCDACGFRAADYGERDLATAPRWLGGMSITMTEGVDASVLAGEPIVSTRAALDDVFACLGPDREAGPTDAAAVHEGVELLRRLSRQIHSAGAGTPTQVGTLEQISTSDGGVPKSSVASADIGPRGLLGDRQANRKHHGRPFQAVCLWSADVIGALRAEGHPVHAGAAGENLTVAGIDWSSLRPGARLLVGEVLLEASAWAEPCRKNDQWFTGRSDRIHHDQNPGWSRLYAWVLEPGTVRVGDAVTVEP